MTFWIGLALAVPLAIAANLLTPAIQRWLAQTSEARRHQLEAQIAERTRVAEELAGNPAALTHLLLVASLRAILISAIAGVLTALPVGLAQALQAAVGYSQGATNALYISSEGAAR